MFDAVFPSLPVYVTHAGLHLYFGFEIGHKISQFTVES